MGRSERHDKFYATDGDCPVCGSDLVEGEVGPFETMMEHVGAPNKDIPDRQGYECPNMRCVAYEIGAVWLGARYQWEGPYRCYGDGHDRLKQAVRATTDQTP